MILSVWFLQTKIFDAEMAFLSVNMFSVSFSSVFSSHCWRAKKCCFRQIEISIRISVFLERSFIEGNAFFFSLIDFLFSFERKSLFPLGSISPSFHDQLLRVQIPKWPKDTNDLTVFLRFGICACKNCAQTCWWNWPQIWFLFI